MATVTMSNGSGSRKSPKGRCHIAPWPENTPPTKTAPIKRAKSEGKVVPLAEFVRLAWPDAFKGSCTYRLDGRDVVREKRLLGEIVDARTIGTLPEGIIGRCFHTEQFEGYGVGEPSAVHRLREIESAEWRSRHPEPRKPKQVKRYVNTPMEELPQYRRACALCVDVVLTIDAPKSGRIEYRPTGPVFVFRPNHEGKQHWHRGFNSSLGRCLDEMFGKRGGSC